MNRLNIAPTKSNQISLKRELDTATTGFQLLKQKREILAGELMRLLDQVRTMQENLAERQRNASATLRQALAFNGYQHMQAVAAGIQYEHKVHAGTRITAGVRVPNLTVQPGKFHSQFGFMGTDSLVDKTMEDFLALTEAAGQLAELETAVWLLAREMKKTQRRVNALEHIFIPQEKETLKFIVDSLESRELDSFATLKLVKKHLEAVHSSEEQTT